MSDNISLDIVYACYHVYSYGN